MCRTYFVSWGGGIGGISWSSVSVTGAPPGPMLQLEGLAVDVAGLGLPLLALAAVGRELEDAAVGEVEGLVAVEQGLHGVLAGLQLRE